MRTMEQREKVGKRILKIFLILNAIAWVLFIYSFAVFFIVNREHLGDNSYDEADRIELIEDISARLSSYHYEDLTNEQIRERVQQYIKPVLYIETSRDIAQNGLTISQLRLIIIKNGLTAEDYCYTLIHEYMHLVNMLHDEALTDYYTIKLMWESEDNYLRYVCCQLIISKETIYLGNEYDCTALLIEYFKGV